MSESNQLATSQPNFVRASTALSEQLGLEPRAMIDAIKTQFFKGKEATDAQLAVVVSTARELGLNPLLPGQLYPYPDRSGSVTIMLGPDGIYCLLANNKDIVAQPDGGPAYWAEHGKDEDGKEICTGYVNHKTKGLLKKTIWVDEWVVASNPNWSARRRHMAEIRALKQTARMVIHGIPVDADEHKIGEMLNVTPDTTPDETPAPKRPAPPKRNTKGVAAVVENSDKSSDAPAPVIDLQPEPEAAPTPEPTPVPAPEPEPAKATAANKSTVDESDFEPTPEDKRSKAARTSLNDGEQYSATVEVVEVTPFMANVKKGNDKIPTPSVSAVLKGEYEGTVMDIGGGIKKGDEVIPANYWKVGARLSIELIGKLNKASGNVGTRVESAKLLEAPAGNAAVEVE